jgi:hypothetical protein
MRRHIRGTSMRAALGVGIGILVQKVTIKVN